MDLIGNTKEFPGFNHIYYMEHQANGYESFYADLEDCVPQAPLLRGEWLPDAPLEARWSMGKHKPDNIAWGCTSAWLYLSPRVQELLQDQKFTGYSLYPVFMYDRAKELCPGYAGFSITGRCGPIDNDRGKVAPGQEGEAFAEHIGLYFNEFTWDGSDLFCPAGINTYMFATEQVRNLFEEYDLGGFEFTPLTEATWYP